MGYTIYNIRKFFFPLAVTCFVVLLMSGCNRPETYTVTFNPNGGTGTMAVQTFTEDEAQTLTLNAFTYEGHTFASWNIVQDGSGASYNDGQTITATSDMTLYAQWIVVPQRHEYVDLGLPSGTKWATCNVGANTPEEYGGYFAWAETTPKETYLWNTYEYCNGGGGYNTLTKYCNNAEHGNDGFTDELTTLEVSDDAATANWGVGWRTPTKEEFDELINNCTVTWILQSGVNGCLFTGFNGNSIFLPAAGYCIGSSLRNDGSDGHYWSSTLDTVCPVYVWSLDFYSGNYSMGRGGDRFYGSSVRPVYVN